MELAWGCVHANVTKDGKKKERKERESTPFGVTGASVPRSSPSHKGYVNAMEKMQCLNSITHCTLSTHWDERLVRVLRNTSAMVLSSHARTAMAKALPVLVYAVKDLPPGVIYTLHFAF